MIRCLTITLGIVVLLAHCPAWSQPIPGFINQLVGPQRTFELSAAVYVDQVDGATRSQLKRVGELLANEHWEDAVETLMRIGEERPERLVRISGEREEFPVHVGLRQHIIRQLCSLPSQSRQALQSYRARVDAMAERWYREGVANRDFALLGRVVSEMLPSSAGDDAMDAMATIALQQGHYNTARQCWERLHPALRWEAGSRRLPYWFALRGVDPTKIGTRVQTAFTSNAPAPDAYPDSTISLADVWARLVLVSILEGSRDRARFELAILRHVAPEGQGMIAGKNVNFVTFLERMLADSDSWPPLRRPADWPTFAGNGARNHVAPKALDIALRPVWSVELEPPQSASVDVAGEFSWPRARIAEGDRGLCSYFPIVTRGLVLISDGANVRGFNLYNGDPAWPGSSEGQIYPVSPDDASAPYALPPRQLGVPRFTLSAHQSLLLARTGSAVTVSPNPLRARQQVVGLNLAAEGAIQFGPLDPDGEEWSFQGTPVTDGNLCWIGMRRSDVTPQEYVACFDVRDGRMRWRQRICAAETPGGGEVDEVSNNLLTYQDGVVYCNSNLGAIAALSAVSGELRWLTLYPRHGAVRKNLLDEPWHLLRDPNPCVVHGGLVIAAPADCAHLFALDANTGQMVWKTDVASDAVHILGVVGDHLIVTGQRVWWLDVYSGKLSDAVAENPFPSGPRAEPRGFGRGVLAGACVYWPTRGENSEIYVLGQRTGRRVRQPINLTAAGASAGNLLIAREHLVVAAPDRLYVFNELGVPLGVPSDEW